MDDSDSTIPSEDSQVAETSPTTSEDKDTDLEQSIDEDSLPDLPLDPEPEDDELTESSAVKASEEDTTDSEVTEDNLDEPENNESPDNNDDDGPEENDEASQEEDALAAEIKAALEATALEDEEDEEDEAQDDHAQDDDPTQADKPEDEDIEDSIFGRLNPRIPIGIGAFGVILGLISLQMGSRSAKQAEAMKLQFDTFQTSMNVVKHDNEKANAEIEKLQQQLQAFDSQVKQKIAPLHQEIGLLQKFDQSVNSKLKWNTETIQLINLTIGKLFNEKVEGNRERFQDELVEIMNAQQVELTNISQASPPPLHVDEESKHELEHSHVSTLVDKNFDHDNPASVTSHDIGSNGQHAGANEHEDHKDKRAAEKNFEIGKHTVQLGDTLEALAQKYDISIAALFAANPEMDPRDLQVGEIIYLPPQSDGL